MIKQRNTGAVARGQMHLTCGSFFIGRGRVYHLHPSDFRACISSAKEKDCHYHSRRDILFIVKEYEVT